MSTDRGLEISAAFPYEKKKIQVLGNQIAYVDVGSSSSESAVVFLHGNPTSSYLWRNVFPHVAKKSRCIIPDLIGFGDSDKVPGLEYRVRDHQRYIDALDAVLPTERVTLVIHDWGLLSALTGLAVTKIASQVSHLWNGFQLLVVDGTLVPLNLEQLFKTFALLSLDER